jgi:hypothetical protein
MGPAGFGTAEAMPFVQRLFRSLETRTYLPVASSFTDQTGEMLPSDPVITHSPAGLKVEMGVHAGSELVLRSEGKNPDSAPPAKRNRYSVAVQSGEDSPCSR